MMASAVVGVACGGQVEPPADAGIKDTSAQQDTSINDDGDIFRTFDATPPPPPPTDAHTDVTIVPPYGNSPPPDE